jgi:hypothetical protein
MPSANRLTISKTRVFDSSYRKSVPGGVTLTELHPTSMSVDIGSPDQFLLPLGFVVTGFHRATDGSIKLRIKLTGETAAGTVAWVTDDKFTTLDDWKNRLIPDGVGARTVLNEFNVQEGIGIPATWAVQCAKTSELAQWSGVVDIEVVDELSVAATAHEKLTFDLQKHPTAQEETRPSNCSNP